MNQLRRVVFPRSESGRIDAEKLIIQQLRIGVAVAVRQCLPYATLKCDEKVCVRDHIGLLLQA